MIRITSAEGGVVRSGHLVVVAWDPNAFPTDEDPAFAENEQAAIARYSYYSHEIPAPPAVEVEVDAITGEAVELRDRAGKRVTRRWTQEISDELAAAMPDRGPIFEYMNWAHKLTHAPPHLHLASILPAVSYECSRRNYMLEHGDGLHLWSAVIAPSAAGKTTCVSYAQDFTEDYHKRIKCGVEKAWVSLEGSLPGVVSVLMEMLDENQGITPAIVFHHEMSAVLRAEESSELLCQLYDMRTYEKHTRYDQKRRDKGEDVKSKVVNPRVSAVVTSTRPAMQKIFQDHMIGGGLASRFTWWYVHQMAPEDLMQRQLLDSKGRTRALDAWASWTGVLDSFMAIGAGRKISINMDAEEVFTEFFDNDLRAVIADPTNLLASVAARANMAVMRVAAVYALSIGQMGVDEDCARRAVNMMRMSLKQANTLLPTLTENEFGRFVGEVLEALNDAGPQGLKRRDLYRVLKHQPKDVLDRVRDALVDAEKAVEITLQPTRGGRPSQRLVHSDHMPKLVQNEQPSAPSVQAAKVQPLKR